jgi:hypothetical protein
MLMPQSVARNGNPVAMWRHERQEETIMERSPELRDLTLRLYDAMAKGDIGFFRDRVSRQPGVVCIGTDPAQWWEGQDAFVQALGAEMQGMGGGFPVTPGDPQAYRAGSTGWAADRFTINVPGGPSIPIRLTVVYELVGADWQIVQWHGSVGIGNEEVVGEELAAQMR